MKKFFTAVWDIMTSIGQAKHAAYLARQGKLNEVKDLYRL